MTQTHSKNVEFKIKKIYMFFHVVYWPTDNTVDVGLAI